MIERSFPELREFLEKEILGPDYPVKHLIEQARSKGYISRGKPGRGGAKVTTKDAATLLLGSLSGDTPQTATDAMAIFQDLKLQQSTFGVHFPENTALSEKWWNTTLIAAVCEIIDAHRRDRNLDLEALCITISRQPKIGAKIIWNDLPFERDEYVSYELPERDVRKIASTGRRVISASLYGNNWRLLADWLEDRSPFCEPGSFRSPTQA